MGVRGSLLWNNLPTSIRNYGGLFHNSDPLTPMIPSFSFLTLPLDLMGGIIHILPLYSLISPFIPPCVGMIPFKLFQMVIIRNLSCLRCNDGIPIILLLSHGCKLLIAGHCLVQALCVPSSRSISATLVGNHTWEQ